MSFNSIRVQLVAGLLFPLAAVGLLQQWAAYRTASATAQSVTDTLLLASARSIAENLSNGGEGVQSIIPPSALSIFALGHGDVAYYRVTTSDGRLLAGYPDLDAPYTGELTDAPQYYDRRFKGHAVRIVVVTRPIPTPKGTLRGFVAVAETLRGQTAMSQALWMQASRQQALLVLVALVVAWFMLRRGLRPMLRLSAEVESRRPEEYRAFAVESLQTELRPLVIALNGFLGRLQNQVEAQRRFTANAAHQLRTPLTLLRTQVVYALRSSEGERLEAVRASLATTRQLVRLTNQLLALARSEGPPPEAPRFEEVDLAVAVREILEEHGALAVERQLDLSFDVEPGTAPIVRADPSALRDLIVNLTDNAIRYTPPGGQVAVTVGREQESCFMLIEDSGPGIPVAQRELVFERFYRLREGETDGSGLGLAIVKEIVNSHGAAIALRDRVPGPGFAVEVRFKLAG